MTDTPADNTEIEVLDGAMALTAVDRASIDMQIATAKQYPRSVTKSLEEARTLATLDEETAGSMFYSIPRGGKTIEGPSARLAEIMIYSWGNLRVDADIVAEDATHITAMGTCMDLERNIAVRVRVKRRITNRAGKKFDADMIGVTGNAAISIALRNCVFKTIPASLTNGVYRAARRASLGEGGTITQKRQKALDWFGKLGVKPPQVFKVLGVGGLDDIGEEELITLRGLVTAIQDGDTTVEQTFHKSVEQPSQGAKDLNDVIGKGEDEPPADASEDKVEADRENGGESSSEGAEGNDGDHQPGQPTSYQVWLTMAAQYKDALKKALGEEPGDVAYREVLALYNAKKANNVSHDKIVDALASLQKVVEAVADDSAPAPSAAALSELQGMRKGDLVQAVHQYEQKVGTEHREAYGVDVDDHSKSTANVLRTYAARLADLVAGADTSQKDPDQQGGLF